MFNLTRNFQLIRISSELMNNYSTYVYRPELQPVKKCHRKPRWIPVAKSKRFRVPEKPNIPEDEQKEQRRLHNNYKNNVKSIRRFLTVKHCLANQINISPEEILKHFKEDLISCQEINDKWNEEVRQTREKRVEEQLKSELDFARNRIEEEIKREREIFEFTESLVKMEKEASVSFITPENIDATIDTALSETVDYNFAVDLNGEKIVGRETKPVQEKAKVSVRQ